MHLLVELLRRHGFVYLLAIHPVLSLFSANAGEVQFRELVWPLAIVLATTALIHIALHSIVRAPQRANFATILFTIAVFYYEHLLGVFQKVSMLQSLAIVGGRSFLMVSLPAVGIGVVAILLTPERALERAASIGKRFSVLLILVTIATLGWNRISSWDFRHAEATELIGQTPSSFGSDPDIYHIVLDGYGRHDFLKDYYDFDNRWFLEWLESKGFYVAHQARSNYAFTRFSLASVLNFRYLDDVPPGKLWAFFNMLQNNRAMTYLRERGYNVVAFDTGQRSFDIRSLSTHYRAARYVLSEFHSQALNLTPFPAVLRLSALRSRLHRETILGILDGLSNPSSENSPKLVYAHLFLPHPPYVFDAEGNSLTPEKFELLPELPPGLYKQLYADQARFATKRIHEVIGGILEQTDGRAVIIVHADHGPAFTAYPGMDPQERFAILYAVFLPSGRYEDFHPELTPVNTYRLVFNDLFGAGLPTLENVSYRETDEGTWARFGGEDSLH